MLGIVAASLALALAAGGHWIWPIPHLDPVDATVLWQLRLPRALAAFAVGALLALAGAWLQVMLVNPLAEPYILGAASCGALGAAMGLWLGHGQGAVAAGAWIGAMGSVLLLARFFPLGRVRLLLAGVVLGAFASALLSIVLALISPWQMEAAIGWLLGDLGRMGVPTPWLWGALLALLGAGWMLADSLDRMMLGEMLARQHGVDVARMRIWLAWLASLATATAVAAAGTIGFVGLIAPHATRLVFGARHRVMLPAAALSGGAFLVFADTIARTIAAPIELPVGAITAIFGAPLFLYLLVKR
ncbi:MAG: iron ABC transporter permease [Zetaproteobacteria bacterium]|nr:MAG: iron ABC transporter permease [Zetaproteobacteria bacterium]